MFNFFNPEQNEIALDHEYHKLRIQMAMLNIAKGSHQYKEISENLRRGCGQYHRYDGEVAQDRVEYIALHRTTAKWPSAFVHTVMVKLNAGTQEIFPLFLEQGRVRVGQWPIGSGNLQNFDGNGNELTSSSSSDVFAGLLKINSVPVIGLQKFSAAYSLDAMIERWVQLERVADFDGFRVTASSEPYGETTLFKLALTNIAEPELNESYAFYIRKSCQEVSHMRGINSGTYYGPEGSAFKGLALTLVDPYVENITLHEFVEAPDSEKK